MRNERNQKLDIAAERLLHCVVTSEQGEFSPIYLIQDAEAQELLKKVFNDKLIQSEQTSFSDSIDRNALKTSIADSIYQAPEYPLGDEEVAFLAFNRDDENVRSVKLKNLFKKSQFSIVNFLMQLSHSILELGSYLTSPEDGSIPFIFKLICCIIFTMSSLIQQLKIDFDDKYCRILFELLNDDNGLIGTNKDVFVNKLFEKNSHLFNGINDINLHIDKLKDLGCLDEKKGDNDESLIYIKEKIVRVK